jgi:hypothetical protein
MHEIQGDYSDQVHSDQMVLGTVSRGGRSAWAVMQKLS